MSTEPQADGRSDADEAPVLERELHDSVVLLTLNRPRAANGLNGALLKALFDAIARDGHDDDIRAIVVAGRGSAWCGGGDHSDLDRSFGHSSGNELFYAMGDTGLPAFSPNDQLFDPLGPGRWILDVHAVEKPLIAAVTGSVAGGGLGFLGLHDYRIASVDAKFVPIFAGLAVGPDFGASWFLPRHMGLAAASRLLLGNRTATAEEAFHCGLVHEIVPAHDVVDRAMQFAQELAQLPPLGVRAVLRALRASLTNSLREQLELEWRGQDVVFRSATARDALQRQRKGTRPDDR